MADHPDEGAEPRKDNCWETPDRFFDIAPLPVKIPDPAFELLDRWHADILKSYGGCP